MARYLFIIVGAFLLSLANTANATNAEPTPRLAPDKIKASHTAAIGGLYENTGLPAQTLISEGTPITILPKTWPALVLAAGPYARFRTIIQHATHVSPTSAEDLERLMVDLASFDGAKFSRAFHAHAVLDAMKNSFFVAGIESWGSTYDRKVLIKNLLINPAYVEQMPGYQQARVQVLKTIEEDGRTALLAGKIYKTHAYTLQRLKWASKARGGKAARLAGLRDAPFAPQDMPEHLLHSLMGAYEPLPPTTFVSPANSTALVSLPSNQNLLAKIVSNIGPNAAMANSPAQTTPPAPTVAPSYQGQLQDILAAAALQILDHDTPYPSVPPPHNTPDYMAECVDWARLHLNQCVAATRYAYEDSFCISRHQLNDAGQCIAAFTGTAQPTTH